MSDIIDHNLIDFYVPFLPLEKSHIEECIKKTAKKLNYDGDSGMTEYVKIALHCPNTGLLAITHQFYFHREVMKTMTFSPEPEGLFAHSGCKRVDQQVRVYINGKKYGERLKN